MSDTVKGKSIILTGARRGIGAVAASDLDPQWRKGHCARPGTYRAVQAADNSAWHGLSKKPSPAINEFSQSMSIARYWRPDDITGVTILLASTGSNDVTGQTDRVDGGTVLI